MTLLTEILINLAEQSQIKFYVTKHLFLQESSKYDVYQRGTASLLIV